MRPRLRHRAGISTYLQTFILIGIALSGSVLVVRAITGLTSASTSMSVSNFSVRSGAKFSYLQFTVVNQGTVSITSLVVLTPGALKSATYCYEAWSASTQATLASTCPSMTPDPTSVSLPLALPPQSSAQVEIVISGGAFVSGRAYAGTVLSDPASQVSFSAVAVPG